MADADTQYIKEIREGLGLWPVWPPGTPINLGTIGVFDQERNFVAISDLSNLGITFQTSSDPTPNDIEYVSKSGVEIRMKLKGKSAKGFQSLAKLDAGVGFNFKWTGATVFRAKACYYNRIADQPKLRRDILALSRSDWNNNWVVVSEVVNAGPTTILVANANNSGLELRATADVKAGGIDIADVSLGLHAAYQSSMAYKEIAKEGLTPLFRALKKKSWIDGGGVGPYSIRNPEDVDGSDELEEVEYATAPD